VKTIIERVLEGRQLKLLHTHKPCLPYAKISTWEGRDRIEVSGGLRMGDYTHEAAGVGLVCSSFVWRPPEGFVPDDRAQEASPGGPGQLATSGKGIKLASLRNDVGPVPKP